MALTEETKQQYLNANGVNCPFCGSNQTKGGFVEIDAGHAHQPISCLECDKRWNDVYTLHGLEEVEP
ncbi:MAG TPA: hypothetical protein VM243_10750 [Phycisphaerae bacterium]|nr:hypothetical protein [Phycisphaerae bacterium]